jgi:hypothetical protein
VRNETVERRGGAGIHTRLLSLRIGAAGFELPEAVERDSFSVTPLRDAWTMVAAELARIGGRVAALAAGGAGSSWSATEAEAVLAASVRLAKVAGYLQGVAARQGWCHGGVSPYRRSVRGPPPGANCRGGSRGGQAGGGGDRRGRVVGCHRCRARRRWVVDAPGRGDRGGGAGRPRGRGPPVGSGDGAGGGPTRRGVCPGAGGGGPRRRSRTTPVPPAPNRPCPSRAWVRRGRCPSPPRSSCGSISTRCCGAIPSLSPRCAT